MKEPYLYLSHLTFRRAWNLLLCMVGYIISRVSRLPIVLGKPWSISIEPTTRCNFQCTECPTGVGELGRKSGDMPFHRFTDIINEAERTALAVLLHFQGEPMMHPDICKMVEYASSKRIITEMATNAALIDEEAAERLVVSGLKKMVVSIDSPFEDGFGFYRKGGNMVRVMKGIENIQRSKAKHNAKYPLLYLELLAFRHNITQMDDFIKLGKSMRADGIRVKTVQLINADNAEEKLPLGTKYSRYQKTEDGSIVLKGRANSPCSAPWFKLSVTHDGWIVPCCFDKSATYVLGSTNFQTMYRWWFSGHYNHFRKRLINYRYQMPVCSTCPQGRTKIDFYVG